MCCWPTAPRRQRDIQRASESLHAARGDVEVDVPQGVIFVFGNCLVAEDPVIQNGQAPRILVANYPGQLRLRDHVILNCVAGSRVVCGLDDSTVAVEGELVF